MSFFLTDGPIMPYAWGSRGALSLLLGRPPQAEREAELWMGAHPKGPSRLLEGLAEEPTESKDLRTLIEGSPARYLGALAAERWGELPFLFKVLAIDRPLSLQAHPDQGQARAGYAREDALGIGRASAERNYRDENHKPELLLALSPVDLVCGFREVPDLVRVLDAFGLQDQAGPLRPALVLLAEEPTPAGIERFFRSLFMLTAQQLKDVTEVLLARAEVIGRAALQTPPPAADLCATARWVLKLAEEYGSEPGLIVFLLLRQVTLQPGQAVYLEPRRLHAYLSGLGLEVMANSDNVLRGGLTKKHVDVEELSAVLDFRPSQPLLVAAEQSSPGSGVRQARWNTPSEEFSLRRFVLQGARLKMPAPSLLLVLDGDLEVSNTRGARRVTKGAQVFCAADEATFVSGVGELYSATLPFV